MEHNPTVRIASNLRAELGRRQLSGRELARLCGWTVTSGSRRVKGTQSMTMDELLLITRNADIPLAVLLDGVEGVDQTAISGAVTP